VGEHEKEQETAVEEEDQSSLTHQPLPGDDLHTLQKEYPSPSDGETPITHAATEVDGEAPVTDAATDVEADHEGASYPDIEAREQEVDYQLQQSPQEEETAPQEYSDEPSTQETAMDTYWQQEGQRDEMGGDGNASYDNYAQNDPQYQNNEVSVDGGGYDEMGDAAPPADDYQDSNQGDYYNSNQQTEEASQTVWKQKMPLQINTEWDTRKVYPVTSDYATGAGLGLGDLGSPVGYDYNNDMYGDYGWDGGQGGQWAIPDEEEKDSDDEDEEENLGDDFEETPWVPPSEEKALKYRARRVFLEGKAPLCAKEDFSDLGLGMKLYFSFLRTLMIMYIILVLLNAPALRLYSYGSRIAEEKRDFLGMYAYTLGNLGSITTDGSIKATNKLTMRQAAGVLTFMDIMTSITFLIAIGYLSWKLSYIKLKAKNITVKDFAVFVKVSGQLYCRTG